MAIARVFLVYLLVLGVLGPFLVLAGILFLDISHVEFDPQRGHLYRSTAHRYGDIAYNYLMRLHDPRIVWEAYGWMLYAILVLVLLYVALLQKILRQYDNKPLVLWPDRALLTCWLISIASVLACGAILYVQLGYQHPLLASLDLGWREFMEKRIEVERSISAGVYSIGLYVFCAVAASIVIMFLRRWWTILATAVVITWFATFSLAKAPIPYLVLELVIIGLLLRFWSFRAALVVLAAASVGLAAALGFTLKSGNMEETVIAFVLRFLLGQFSDLPAYFEAFWRERLPLLSLLPPYVQDLLGINSVSAARAVAVATVAPDDRAISGVANTIFIGEAYAVMGLPGVIMSPFLVFANLFVVAKVFTYLEKDPLNIFVFGYLVFKFLIGLFAGISVYLLSSAQILFLGYLVARLLAKWYLPLILTRPPAT